MADCAPAIGKCTDTDGGGSYTMVAPLCATSVETPSRSVGVEAEIGVGATVGEIAVAEKINSSYVSRVLRLTLLAPDLVERILDGTHSRALTLARLTAPFPVAWAEQRAWFASDT